MKFFSVPFTAFLLISVSNFSTAKEQPSNTPAPEVTATEAELSFWDMPGLKKPFIDTDPTKRKDAISVGALDVDGSKSMVVKLAKQIGEGKYGKYDSLLIAQKDTLLFESYFLRGRVNLPHFQASATKSYTSLALGRAVELGYLTMADLDKPLVSFLKKLDTKKLAKGVEKITLHKALTMSSGLVITEEQYNTFNKKPDLLKGQGLAQVFLENSPPVTKESQVFSYKGPDPDLVMQVLEVVVPGTAKDFIEKELLGKMGITNYSWSTGVSGFPEAGGGASLTSRDMLKVGALLLNGGKWQGEQLISADYLTKATTGFTQATEVWQPKTYIYGYFLYHTIFNVDDKSYSANIAWGGGGQHIIVIEELDLVVVITGHDREDKIVPYVVKNILPAFTK